MIFGASMLAVLALGITESEGLLADGTITSTGDVCTRSLAEEWSKGRRLYNAYGPTEVTVGASIGGPIEGLQEEVTIGTPWDGGAVYVLLADLATLYDDPGALDDLTYTFGQYLAHQDTVRAAERERAREYWQQRLPSLPGGPKLPLAADPEAVAVPRFVRRSCGLTADEWRLMERRASEAGLTPSVVLATAFAMVLGRWSGEERFLLNLPLFDRDLDAHPQINRVVADFTGLVLVEVDLSGESFADRARTLQKQMHEDIGHAAYSGVDVLRDFVRTDVDAPRTAPVVFACDLSAPLVPDAFQARFGEASWMISQTPQIWLDHQVYRTRDGGVLLVWDAVEELFPDGMLDAMAAAYESLVRGLLTGGWDTAAPRIPLPAEQRERRAAVNARTRPLTGNLLHTTFFERAATGPDGPPCCGASRTSWPTTSWRGTPWPSRER
ncbi:hypothetical protein SGLAM104S_04227 [Streptomyces glaucescens]